MSGSGYAKKILKVVVLGYGYWGPHMARNISQLEDFELTAIVDFSESRKIAAAEMHPEARIFSSLEEALGSVTCDAVVVATPSHTHFHLAKAALMAGLHVIVEKPLSTNLDEARELTGLAKSRGLILLVDHTYVYSPAIEMMRKMVLGGELGDLVYFDSTRVNLGLFQPDVSVLWDLAVHDLAILQRITGRVPNRVSAAGGLHHRAKYEAASFLTLYYDDMFFAHINVSWLSPMKVRRTVISGTKKTILFDDMMPDERLRIYDAGVEQNDSALLQYRLGDISIPKLVNSEALRTELIHFHESIVMKKQPISSGESAIEIIATLQAAQESTESGSRVTEIVL
jgi:predicted dehydrogenase